VSASAGTTARPSFTNSLANLYPYVDGNPLSWTDRLGLEIGDFPPAPPGYNPGTWRSGRWSNGRNWLQDPRNGDVYTLHPEDRGHWRHWDKRDKNGGGGGMCPPNSKKPWPGQKRPPYDDQSASDPNGDASPWTPPDPEPPIGEPEANRTIIPTIPVDPVPVPEVPPTRLPPMRLPPIRVPILIP
jgi:hypothetical protein